MDEGRSGAAHVKLAQQFHRAARLLDVAAEGSASAFVEVPGRFNRVRALQFSFVAMLLANGSTLREIEHQDVDDLYGSLPASVQSLLQSQLGRAGVFDMFASPDALGEVLSKICRAYGSSTRLSGRSATVARRLRSFEDVEFRYVAAGTSRV